MPFRHPPSLIKLQGIPCKASHSELCPSPHRACGICRAVRKGKKTVSSASVSTGNRKVPLLNPKLNTLGLDENASTDTTCTRCPLVTRPFLILYAPSPGPVASSSTPCHGFRFLRRCIVTSEGPAFMIPSGIPSHVSASHSRGPAQHR